VSYHIDYDFILSFLKSTKTREREIDSLAVLIQFILERT